jgi:hypothetical protein
MAYASPAPRFVASNSRHRYPSAHKCIYCGSSGTAGEALGEEHIIPLSFGGNLILPFGSCRACERITTAIEDHCVKGMISTARPHLGIVGRQKRRNPLARGPVYIDHGSRTETRSVPIQTHPGAILMPVRGYPAALVGAALPSVDHKVEMRIAIKPMTPDLIARSAKFPGRVTMTKGLSALMFCRFVAKISHAFTAAEPGVDSFTPYLLNLIRGSCPKEWCKSGDGFALSGGSGRFCQAATAGSLTKGSSLKGAMVSSVM